VADEPTDLGEGALPRPRRRLGLEAAAVTVGLMGLGASLVGGAAGILPRHFTPTQQQKIVSWEMGKRWRSWPAGQIFPAQIVYRLPAASLASSTGLTLTAHRVAIMPETSCADAADAEAAQVMARHGCEAVLRATYSDAAGAFVTTVGIAVFPGAKAGAEVHGRLSASRDKQGEQGDQPGVRAEGVAGTPTAWFADSGRQVSSSIAAGPYLVMYAAGYADGRPREAADANQYSGGELLRVSESIAGDIAARIGAPPPLPRCPGSPGC
jgi:hypothetical protein